MDGSILQPMIPDFPRAEAIARLADAADQDAWAEGWNRSIAPPVVYHAARAWIAGC